MIYRVVAVALGLLLWTSSAFAADVCGQAPSIADIAAVAQQSHFNWAERKGAVAERMIADAKSHGLDADVDRVFTLQSPEGDKGKIFLAKGECLVAVSTTMDWDAIKRIMRGDGA